MIRTQAVKCTGVGMSGGRTVPARNGTDSIGTALQEGRTSESLPSHLGAELCPSFELQPFPLEALPFTHRFPGQQMPWFYFWERPLQGSSLYAQTDKQAQSPHGLNLSSLCSCMLVISCDVILCHVKNVVIQRSGLKFKDNVMFIWNISMSNALPDTLCVPTSLSQL